MVEKSPPAGMDAGTTASSGPPLLPPEGISDNVAGLVDRLSPDAARALYNEVRPAAPAAAKVGERGLEAIRHALVGKLNTARRAHARRQFTELFEPFITPFDWLLREPYGAPGAIHALDVGGVWTAMAGRMLATLAHTIDNTLAEMAAQEPLYLVLRTPKALALQEELRTTAAAKLGGALKDRVTTAALLDAANGWRIREAQLKGLGVTPRPLVAQDLAIFHAVLVAGKAYQALAQKQDRAEEDGERPRGSLFTKAARAGRADEPEVDPAHKPTLDMLLALGCLDRRRDYSGIVPFLLDAQAAARAGLPDALNRHLTYICQRLAAICARLSGAGQTSRRPLIISPDDRRELERELGHLEALLGIFDEFDMLGDGRLGAMMRDTLTQMIKSMEGALYPYLTARVVIAAQSRGLLGVDHAALAWMLDFITRWRDILTRGLHWGMGFSEFRDHLVVELAQTYRSAFGRTITPSRERLGQAVRAAQLADALGINLRGRMTLLDRGLIQTARECLKDPQPLSDRDEDLLRAIQHLAEDELERTRHWRDPSLASFVELAKERLGAMAPGGAPTGTEVSSP